MKPVEWKTYRTRFLVKAKQLSSSLGFVDPLGRQHCGRKGDYLVESSDGVISIAPRQIFEDIYVPMSLFDEPEMSETRIGETRIDDKKIEALEVEEVRLGESNVDRPLVDQARMARREAAQVRRPLPQPCRDRRSSTQGLTLMQGGRGASTDYVT